MPHLYHNRDLFPHPVLCAERGDYRADLEFNAECETAQAADDHDIHLGLKVKMNAPVLLALVRAQAADYAAVCLHPATLNRHLALSGFNAEWGFELPLAEWEGQFTVLPALVAVRPLALPADDLEAGLAAAMPDDTSLAAGSVLALGDSLELDSDKESRLASVIELQRLTGVRRGSFHVDLSGERIAICLHADDFHRVQLLRRQRTEALLETGLYLHAVTKALRSLRDGGGGRWTRVLARKLDEVGIDPDDADLAENAEVHAQRLTEYPLEHFIKTAEGIFHE